MTRPTRLIRAYPRPQAGGLGYDNSGSGLSADTIQEAIDELAAGAAGIAVTDLTTTVDPTTVIEFDPVFFVVTDGDYGIAEVTLTGSSGGAVLPLTGVVDGEPVLIWDDDDSLIPVEV